LDEKLMKDLVEKSQVFLVVTDTPKYENIKMLPVTLCWFAAAPQLKGSNTSSAGRRVVMNLLQQYLKL